MFDDADGLTRRHLPPPRARAVPVLDAIRVSWEWLCAPPHPVTIDGTRIVGLPNGPLPLDEVRARLLDRGCGLSVRDAVWADLISRSRTDGPTWTIACAGMALPMLAAICRQLSGGRGIDRDDVASAVVSGFVAALASVNLDRPGLASSLRWACVRAGHAALREQRNAPRPVTHDTLVHAALTHTALTRAAFSRATLSPTPGDATAEGDGGERGSGSAPAGRWESTPPPTEGGHPDFVLAAAVADGVLTRAEAVLIGETRLESTTLTQAAARRGRTVGAVTMQRLRAEMRLIDYLRAAQYVTYSTDDDVADTSVARHHRRSRRTPTVTGRRPATSASDTSGPSGGRSRSVRRRRGGTGHDGQVTR